MRLQPGRQQQFAAMLDARGLRSAAGRRDALTRSEADAVHPAHRGRRARDARDASGRRASTRCSTRSRPGCATGSLEAIAPALSEMEIGAARCGERAAQDGRRSELHRRRRLRAPHSGRDLGDRDARRVLQRLHAVPGRGEPGHAAALYEYQTMMAGLTGDGGVERVALRRRLGAGRGLPDGRARAPPLEVARILVPDDGQPDLSRRVTRAIAGNQNLMLETLPFDRGSGSIACRDARARTAARTSPRS